MPPTALLLFAAAFASAALGVAAAVPGASASLQDQPNNAGFEPVLLAGRHYANSGEPGPPAGPDGVFKIRYKGTGLEVDRVLNAPHGNSGFTFGVHSLQDGAMLEVRLPKNYPYTNYATHFGMAATHEGIFSTGASRNVDFEVSESDCHYNYAVPLCAGESFLTVDFLPVPKPWPHLSEPVPDSCMAGNVVPRGGGGSLALSPKAQLGLGVKGEGILCPCDRQLVFCHDGSPACVGGDTVRELMVRGWTHPGMERIEPTRAAGPVWSLPRELPP